MTGLLPHILLAVRLFFPSDTVLTAASVAAQRQGTHPQQVAASVTLLEQEEVLRQATPSPRAAAELIPSLHIPDYGASMTSTIYHRGLGSRMDNPVIGLYVDRIPILEKNAFDFDFLDDLAAVRFWRGAQGVLYGRNAMSGVMEIRSFTPGPEEAGGQVSLDYGSANTLRLKALLYKNRQSFSLGFRHADGWFTNRWNGKRCDPHNGLSFRFRKTGETRGGHPLEHTLSLSALDEGGFAYGLWNGSAVQPVRYNGAAGYRRIALCDGTTLTHGGARWKWQTTGSVQALLDRMQMDQDYTEKSIFTLEQKQRSIGTTLETLVRPVRPFDCGWEPAGGAFVMGRVNRMSAPVRFLPDGVHGLILGNANAHIPPSVGYLAMDEDRFTIGSEFLLGGWNASLWHESRFTKGRWRLTAGLRLDYEGALMDYDSQARIHYRFISTMSASKPFKTTVSGLMVRHFFELLPRASVLYGIPDGPSLFVSAGRGHRAGGFNTQLFSDILQGAMMNGLMKDLGVHMSLPASGESDTAYRPEKAWTFEAGVKWFRLRGWTGGMTLYHMVCTDQQLTVFPPGMTSGRKMTNAGRSRSDGVELETEYRRDGFSLRAAWAWNHAEFVRYRSGDADYAGKRVPYAPEQTLYLCGAYRFVVEDGLVDEVTVGLDARGAGRIWWDEENTLCQPFYMTAGFFLDARFGDFTLRLRGDNLTDTAFRTFYFKSMGNAFFCKGKPARWLAGLSWRF